jgi:transposase
MHNNILSSRETSARLSIPSDVTLLKWERIYYEEGEAGLFNENRGRPNKNIS